MTASYIGVDARTRLRLAQARAWALVGAGYLLFLGAHGWWATTAGTATAPWHRPVLVVGAVLLVAVGVRTGLQTHDRRRFDPAAALADSVAPDPAVAFVGRLYALGPAGWALVVAHARGHGGVRAGARAVLCAVVTDLRLGGAERRLAHAVATVLLRPGATHLPPEPRSVARGAALAAALAVLVRPSLPACDFAVLYAPFSQLIPLDTLASAKRRTPAAVNCASERLSGGGFMHSSWSRPDALCGVHADGGRLRIRTAPARRLLRRGPHASNGLVPAHGRRPGPGDLL